MNRTVRTAIRLVADIPYAEVGSDLAYIMRHYDFTESEFNIPEAPVKKAENNNSHNNNGYDLQSTLSYIFCKTKK